MHTLPVVPNCRVVLLEKPRGLSEAGERVALSGLVARLTDEVEVAEKAGLGPLEELLLSKREPGLCLCVAAFVARPERGKGLDYQDHAEQGRPDVGAGVDLALRVLGRDRDFEVHGVVSELFQSA